MPFDGKSKNLHNAIARRIGAKPKTPKKPMPGRVTNPRDMVGRKKPQRRIRTPFDKPAYKPRSGGYRFDV